MTTDPPTTITVKYGKKGIDLIGPRRWNWTVEIALNRDRDLPSVYRTPTETISGRCFTRNGAIRKARTMAANGYFSEELLPASEGKDLADRIELLEKELLT